MGRRPPPQSFTVLFVKLRGSVVIKCAIYFRKKGFNQVIQSCFLSNDELYFALINSTAAHKAILWFDKY